MGIGYKLFKYRNGKLYPLYVLTDKEVELNKWLPAEAGELQENGKVKAKLGDGLAYRPGWHLNDKAPYVEHIGKKGEDGKLIQRKDTVWAEVEYSDVINYQEEADKNGINKEGKLIKVKACLKHIPENGFYRYKTSPKMFGEWIIAGAIKVNRVLSDEEVDAICASCGLHSQERE